MTKRKASVALDTGNESNHSNGTQDNNSNSTSATTGTNNSNSTTQQNGSSTAGGKQQIASNNQNDNSNSNSNSSSNNNNGGSQHKSKKERADNWSSAEIQVLHRGIETRRDIFYGPPSQATKKNRELAWEAITKEVNSVSTTPRSLSQVMKKFKNEKCRAKRKFTDLEKDGHSNLSSNVCNSNSGNNNNNNGGVTTANNTNETSNLSAQNHANNNQQQIQQQPQQSNHLTAAESISAPQTSINVVKLAPQNVAKTMIDLPGHVQQIQMPNDDMVLIVPPEMDGILSGMNIVSDGNGHHLQKCSGNSTLQNHQHNHHGQHTIQTLSTSQSLANGTISNGMMARTIPAGSMCSLVYSTGNEVCGPEQHVANNVANQSTLSANHIGMNAQNLMHHRVSIEQGQHQQQQQQQQQHHQLHQQHQHQQPHSHQQPQSHQSHQQPPHHQQHLPPNHLVTTATIANTGGVAVESQLKNLLINLLFKDGQHSSMPIVNQDYNKQRNDPLTTIASSLNKIEGHLSKISKIASSLLAQNININNLDNSNITASTQLSGSNTNSLNMTNSDGNNNNVSISDTGSNINNQRGAET